MQHFLRFVTMTDDPDEYRMQREWSRKDPLRVADAIERIEWLLMYGQHGAPLAVKLLGSVAVALLALILWRIW